ncbi:tetratricopeptide repeat-containing sulfotransferase family protein [Biformimicrobium ophioploci]|uniref:Tetratricopeptide repeat-containing sulfotransferase family protein n=1 Tax=Biformimicrobium ophioploci TaxID=3036711 RepID=A0ABQ6M0K3_9GAMM|nr:tetratricopeptide repeat-containing sulfotransferase family protein [Microbulbifer sp. NKW57]
MQLTGAFPGYVNGWLMLCRIHLRAGNSDSAVEAAKRALDLDPEHAGLKIHYCETLTALQRLSEARAWVAPLLDKSFADPYLHDRLGRQLAILDMHRQALAQYKKAISLNGREPGFFYNLATAQRFLGEIESAEASLDCALEVNPLDSEAQAMRSSLRKQSAQDNHVAELKSLLANPKLAPQGVTQICYGLAKELEDLGEYQAAFSYLKQGADNRRQHMRYDVRNDLQTMGQIASIFSKATNPAHGCQSAEPVFILGMPRTGTTLAERILASHSRVTAAGELSNFGAEMTRLVHETSGGRVKTKAALIEASAQLNFKKLGEAYIESTRPVSGQTAHFIDKLPFNYLYIGLIRAALPNAKIINLVRNPMDTCFSVYKQLFRDAYPFSYNLDELAEYYISYRRLMKHWRQVFPAAIYELHYEKLTENPSGETERLLDYMGLEWEEQCLEFYKNEEASTTASASQVRKPVYSSSVGKWKHYETQLAPLAERLQAAGIAID